MQVQTENIVWLNDYKVQANDEPNPKTILNKYFLL